MKTTPLPHPGPRRAHTGSARRPADRPVGVVRPGLLALALLAGCATGEDPAPPAPAAARDFGEPVPPAAEAAAPPAAPGWAVFADPALGDLIARAWEENRDLARAAARVEEAWALARLAGAERAPQVSANASAAHQKSTRNLDRPSPDPENTRWRADLAASYEPDLWGRLRQTVAAAEFEARVTEEDLAAARLSLAAEVARAYFSWAGLAREEAVLEATRALRRESVEILGERARSGLSNTLDLERARVELANLEAEQNGLRRQVALWRHALALLTGAPPADRPAPSFSAAPADPPVIPAGVPADLLLRRPDLAAARWSYLAAAQRAGAARAEFRPRFRLTAGLGLESEDLLNLIEGRSLLWSIAGGLTAPILDGGRNQARLDAARARADAAARQLESRYLAALREVADALSDAHHWALQAHSVEAAGKAARSAAALSRERYQRGLINYLEVVESERAVLLAERAAAQLAAQRQLAAVRLVAALGGDWAE